MQLTRLYSLQDFFNPENAPNVTNKPFYKHEEDSTDFENTSFYELNI